MREDGTVVRRHVRAWSLDDFRAFKHATDPDRRVEEEALRRRRSMTRALMEHTPGFFLADEEDVEAMTPKKRR